MQPLSVQIAAEEGALPVPRRLQNRKRSGGRINHEIAFMAHGGHKLALQVYRLRVRMHGLRGSLLNNIRDGVGFPHALCPARLLLQDDAVFGAAAGAVSHAECAFVPCHQIDDIKARSVEPGAHTLTQVKLVNPQKQVAGRDQGAVYAAHEVTDLCLGHLLQGAPPLVASLAFVPMGQLVEYASIVRIEKAPDA